MIISHITLKNWRNFKEINVQLNDRIFVVGPNACGKSNFLDVFRFLRDLAKPGGGLQRAIRERNGVSKIRCLSARQNPQIEIAVSLSEEPHSAIQWKYAIGIKQEGRGNRQPYLSYEQVWGPDERLLLSRPDQEDQKDKLRLTQTHLEQINANSAFRDIAKLFESVLYLHLVPQLLRHPDSFIWGNVAEDPFGKNFLERVAKTPEKTRLSRLNKIQEALSIAVPQFKKLELVKDVLGIPHLQARYEHWRPAGSLQHEDQFSDGTLRLIGLLWSLLETDSLLLLEEPELSLNAGIVKKIPSLMYRLQQRKKRQLIISTHSDALLSDEGIGGEEVLLLTTEKAGTKVQNVDSIKEIRDLLEGGLTIAEAVLPRTIPPKIARFRQLSLLK
jgi:predicted ATPase